MICATPLRKLTERSTRSVDSDKLLAHIDGAYPDCYADPVMDNATYERHDIEADILNRGTAIVTARGLQTHGFGPFTTSSDLTREIA